jgi:hypothetical protein
MKLDITKEEHDALVFCMGYCLGGYDKSLNFRTEFRKHHGDREIIVRLCRKLGATGSLTFEEMGK